MRIAITGTPGVGKTTVSKVLGEKLGIKVIDITEVVKDYKLYIEKDEDMDSYVIDFEKLEKLNAKVIKSCIYILSNKIAPAVIHKKTPLFYLCVEDNEKIREVFSGSELKVKFSKNIDEDIWKKYLFISTFATLQSFYKKPTGWIMEKKRDEVERFLDEVIKIAKEYGVELSNEKERVIKQALNIPYESKMSMQIDFEENKKTELETITGFLAQRSEFINKFYKELK